MNRFSLYVFLILIFLGLSKSFSPSEQRTTYIESEKVFSSYFNGAPLSLILLDSFQNGFLIKTYYQRYKIVHGFKAPDEIIVRTSGKFWEKGLPFRGMSLFRRFENSLKEEVIPMPPGTLYIGNPSYGHWEFNSSGTKFWRFHRAYRQFPTLFAWGDFIPSFEFFKQIQIFFINERPFYGINGEFGSKGHITKLNVPRQSELTNQIQGGFLSHIKKYLFIPPWNNKELVNE